MIRLRKVTIAGIGQRQLVVIGTITQRTTRIRSPARTVYERWDDPQPPYQWMKKEGREMDNTLGFYKMSHKELVEAGYRWLLKNGSCGVAFKELKTLSWEIPDVIGFGSAGFSAVVECKASRSDFLCDKNKPFRKNPQLGMGSHRYYCCPKGLIKVEELPEGWGLIYVDERGKGRLVHKPLKVTTTESGYTHTRHYAHEKNIQSEHGVMYSALRRLFIKGLVKHIYDQDYTLPKNPDTLIDFNNPNN